jgi:lipoic acid synthetase
VKKHNLHTICQSARCPNIAECWAEKTATFLILGDTCTRNCAFCAVKKGTPSAVAADEPNQVARTVATLGLDYAVITSVTRDDLADGGASIFSETIKAIRNDSGAKVEALIPDFRGDERALDIVLEAKPDILNHNLETPERLYPEIRRPLPNYPRSLAVLERAKRKGAETKSGIMIGLGETGEDILQTFNDLRSVGCDLLTVGQYLQPTAASAPVRKYYSPMEFEELRDVALGIGFKEAESGPLVRSSFHAHGLYKASQKMV